MTKRGNDKKLILTKLSTILGEFFIYSFILKCVYNFSKMCFTFFKMFDKTKCNMNHHLWPTIKFLVKPGLQLRCTFTCITVYVGHVNVALLLDLPDLMVHDK